MKAWFAGLAPRERLVTAAGMGLMVLLMVWALVWEPFRGDYLRLQQTVAAKRDLAAWMTAAASQIRTLNPAGIDLPVTTDDRSLLVLVDQTSREAGLGPFMKRIEPEGQEAVRVWLEQAPFDNLVGWLARIAERHGVHASRAAVDRRDKDGLVNARLTLERSFTTPRLAVP